MKGQFFGHYWSLNHPDQCAMVWNGLDLPEIEFKSNWDLDSEATIAPSKIPTMACFQDIFKSQFGLKFSLEFKCCYVNNN